MIAWRPLLLGKITLTELHTAGLTDMGELLKLNRFLDAIDVQQAKDMETKR
ncbi:hypothetical protein [Rodentibacter ratti]|uniref:hypothetical protein n=1 Tax=Rodentibacter ratti TaxID=1906745 RepID=UPI0015D66705|nr:hypothetical protein [Rodentibacter ratti]